MTRKTQKCIWKTFQSKPWVSVSGSSTKSCFCIALRRRNQKWLIFGYLNFWYLGQLRLVVKILFLLRIMVSTWLHMTLFRIFSYFYHQLYRRAGDLTAPWSSLELIKLGSLERSNDFVSIFKNLLSQQRFLMCLQRLSQRDLGGFLFKWAPVCFLWVRTVAVAKTFGIWLLLHSHRVYKSYWSSDLY